jgi:hypothetical protein
LGYPKRKREFTHLFLFPFLIVPSVLETPRVGRGIVLFPIVGGIVDCQILIPFTGKGTTITTPITFQLW